jgi:2-polyprenyl-3-methyl-5-hydroxy-6-metoxy-1,4-benzoquinol methylase
MQRLTDSAYWNKAYSKIITEESPPGKQNIERHKAHCGFVKSLRNHFVVENYASHLFWNVICPQYLPKAPAKILEVGCAPGKKLVKFAKTFGYEPYGIDFSNPGIESTRELFITNGFNPENVTCADFFNEKFLSNYKGFFDVVVSMGFIEHFTEADRVVERHIQLLREGGVLLISIPNLRGINYALTYLLNREALKLHNLDLMDSKAFLSLFQHPELDKLFCGYYGKFHCGVCISSEKVDSHLAKNYGRLQQIADYCLMKLLSPGRFENRVLSPYLLYIGSKKSRVC